MKVLMISGDKNVLFPNTGAYERLQLQKKAVDQLDVFVWPQMHSQWRIWLATRKRRYDMITTQDPFWRGLLGWKFARLTGAKLNVQVHADLSGQSLFRRLLARFVLRRADSIRVVSEKIKEQVLACGTSASIAVLPVYIDVEKFKALTPRPHDKKVILWIGRFEPEKAPLYAVHVLQEVLEAGIGAKLIMLGEGSQKEATEHEGLKRLVHSASDILPIEFPGWQDPRPFLEIADVVLCTSLYESWGASIVEARMAGVPVVAPDVGAAKQYGAHIAERQELPRKTIEVLLKNEVRSRPDIHLPTAEEWVRQWRASLA